MMAAIALGGCVHQFPDGDGTDPTLVRVAINVTPGDDLLPLDGNAAKPRAGERAARRLVIEARREGKTVDRQVILAVINAAGEPTFPVTLRLHALDYTLVAWCDNGEAATGNDLHYNTSNLSLVTRATPGDGNTNERDCLRGSIPLDLREYRDTWNAGVNVTLPLDRPIARHELVATDARQFLESRTAGETYTVTVAYGFYFPLGCNAVTGEPERSTMNVTFTVPLDITDDGSGEMLVASDNIFTGNEASYLPVSIEIKDSKGKSVSRTTGINVAYQRGRVTTVRGRFLTNRFDTGVGIDPDFDDDDINIDIDEM